MSSRINQILLSTLFMLMVVFLPSLFAFASALCDLSDPNNAIKTAKDALRRNSWDASAQACLVLSYERTGRAFMALRRLRDAEDYLPQHILDSIHDLIWAESPELLARKEFTDRYTLSGGACMIKNISMIDGNGFLILGEYYNPSRQTHMRHLASFRCNHSMSSCGESNLVCAECVLHKPELVIRVKDYRIYETFMIEPTKIDRTVRYIKTVLDMQRDLYAR